MAIELKYFDRTNLNESAYVKLIKKYSSKFTYDIKIIFDLRIKDFGNYTFDFDKKTHVIRISPVKCGLSDKGTKLDDNGKKYHLISTTIHELCHAEQKETLGSEFWSKQYSCAREIKNPSIADFYSKSEVDARIFENKNVLSAVQFYDNACKE